MSSKLVHRSFINGLLHLVQQEEAERGIATINNCMVVYWRYMQCTCMHVDG